MREPYDKEEDAGTEADEVGRVLGETFKNDIPEELDKKMSAALSSFQQDLEHHPYVRRLEAQKSTSRMKWPRPLRNASRLAWLAAGFLLFLIVQWTLVGSAAPTWADVAERFRSVESYSAVIYAKEDAFAEPEQYELWVNSAGRKRMRAGTQMVFATEGGGLRAFDLANRRETEPGKKSVQMLQKSAGAFSLETLMRKFCGDWFESTPKINADAIISEDLVVFDVEHSGSPNWVRVWALRESRLPVQIRSWTPRDGECVDVFFSYSKEQPDGFFDPDAFALKVQDATLDKWRLAYAFLEDPGGRQVQSKSIHEPLVYSTVTRTLNGEPWSLADHRGKAVLVGFWDTASGFDYEQWWKETYEEFGDRDDFVMVGVALDAKAEPVRDYCENKGIEWLQLHEPGKRYKNTLYQAFGADPTRALWLIWKNGEMERLKNGGSQVRAALLGLTYETESDIAWRISHRIGEASGMTREEARSLCGEPDVIDSKGEDETWSYKLPSEDGTAVLDVTLTFDSKGKNTDHASQRRILNPAVAKVTISESYWKNRIEPKLDRGLLRQDNKYGVTILAKSGNREVIIGGGHPWTDVEPGKEYLRPMHPGTYDFYVVVSDKQTFQEAQAILLREGVDLAKGDTREVRFD